MSKHAAFAKLARDEIADYIADNWPNRKYTLAEIEAGIRTVPNRRVSGSFMSREQATEFMRNRLKREPTEAQIAACVEAYSAILGNTVPVRVDKGQP